MASPKFESFIKYIINKKWWLFSSLNHLQNILQGKKWWLFPSLSHDMFCVCVNCLGFICALFWFQFALTIWASFWFQFILTIFFFSFVQIDLTLNSTYQKNSSLILELTHSFLCHMCTIEKHVQNFLIFFIALYETKISTISCGKPLALHRYHHWFSCLQINECLLGLTFPHFQKEKN